MILECAAILWFVSSLFFLDIKIIISTYSRLHLIFLEPTFMNFFRLIYFTNSSKALSKTTWLLGSMSILLKNMVRYEDQRSLMILIDGMASHFPFCSINDCRL